MRITPPERHRPARAASTAAGIAFALASMLLAACGGGGATTDADASASVAAPRAVITTATGATVAIEVDVADEPEERERGLMGRTELADGEGMVFLFGGPTTVSFWMKDTPIPLSIAFWNAQSRIVAILDMPPCAAEPCPTYAPGLPYVGAIEVPRGYFTRRGVTTGDPIVLEGIVD